MDGESRIDEEVCTFSDLEKQRHFSNHSLLHRHLHIHLAHMVSEATNARRARELEELPNTMPLIPKCVLYTPANEATVARKNRRQITQFNALHVPEQGQLFIGERVRVRDRVRVGVSGSVHNDRKPAFLFT